jgi:hypothetical protein
MYSCIQNILKGGGRLFMPGGGFHLVENIMQLIIHAKCEKIFLYNFHLSETALIASWCI